MGAPDFKFERPENTNIYERYKFERKIEPNLAIKRYRPEILETVQQNIVTVIEGPTGTIYLILILTATHSNVPNLHTIFCQAVEKLHRYHNTFWIIMNKTVCDVT